MPLFFREASAMEITSEADPLLDSLRSWKRLSRLPIKVVASWGSAMDSKSFARRACCLERSDITKLENLSVATFTSNLSLAQLRYQQGAGGRLPAGQARQLLRQVADALRHCHAKVVMSDTCYSPRNRETSEIHQK